MNHHIQETRLWEWFGSYGYLSHLHSIHGNTGCIILHYHHGLGSHSHSVTGNRQSIYRSFLRPYRCGLCCTDGLHTWGWRAPNDIDPANQRGALGSFPLGIHGFPMVFLWFSYGWELGAFPPGFPCGTFHETRMPSGSTWGISSGFSAHHICCGV